ncbi:unnamed protein product [Gongylonema pulchrum]|uniref:Uncharacterized protein n=1 Tax=Gongylonema pulchrum TaxID=637853 RepID=A0A183DKW3_9BILA|nr:unnamed protein product [Gongylonema pulchrum]
MEELNYGRTGNVGGYYDEHVRFASVKQRPYPSRRISAKELEERMGRQGLSQFQPVVIQEDVIQNGSGLKFNSVNDLKRRQKQRNGLPRTIPPPDLGYDHHYAAPLKSFTSSPGMANFGF